MKKILILMAVLGGLLLAEPMTESQDILYGKGFVTQDGKFHFDKNSGLMSCTTMNTLINIGVGSFDWSDVNGTTQTITIDKAKAYSGEIFATLKGALLTKDNK